ncbi:hypothetical protein D9M70_503650 [compost metagenome]
MLLRANGYEIYSWLLAFLWLRAVRWAVLKIAAAGSAGLALPTTTTSTATMNVPPPSGFRPVFGCRHALLSRVESIRLPFPPAMSAALLRASPARH